jgi:hypothetical protein
LRNLETPKKLSFSICGYPAQLPPAGWGFNSIGYIEIASGSSCLFTVNITGEILNSGVSRNAAHGTLQQLVLLIFWPGVTQTLFMDRDFVGDERGLIRVVGLTVVVIGWLYLFGARTGGRQFIAASVIDRLIFVPVVLLPLAFTGVFPHLLVAFTILDMSLAVGAWVLFNGEK